MNKYQKKLHKEINEFIKNNNEYSYRIARKGLKMMIRINPFTPCEKCNNMDCNRIKNKIVFCEEQC